jgi:hypothetical protein
MSRGYTVAEVMIALGLLGVGASGVIAMQKATQIGNNNARNIATANAVALSWAERLRAEALQWNAPNGVDDLKTETKWLQHADPDKPVWFNPEEVAPSGGGGPAGSPNADILGGDIFTGDAVPATPAFCTKVRLTRLRIYPDNAIRDPDTSKIIRAEIRVYWHRAGARVDCSPLPDPGALDTARFGFVTLTTAVFQNSVP